MRFKNIEDLDYLSGEKFSNGRQFHFECDEEDYKYRSRVDILKQLVTNKQIIHLGCVDEIDTIKHRMDRGKWLHKELHEVAGRCIGVDINEPGINYIRDELGYPDVCVADVTTQPTGDLAELKWDYFMIPEVLEHVDNPVDFLSKIREHYQANVKQIIITVPNAFTSINYKRAKEGIEEINTDHRYWFTPYTLSKVVVKAGCKIENIIMCRHGRVKRRSLIKNYWYGKHPMLRSDIVMLVSF